MGTTEGESKRSQGDRKEGGGIHRSGIIDLHGIEEENGDADQRKGLKLKNYLDGGESGRGDEQDEKVAGGESVRISPRDRDQVAGGQLHNTVRPKESSAKCQLEGEQP